MSDERHGDGDELVYMVTGEDENGDHHIFVTSDLRRAEARHEAALSQLTAVSANWLELREGRSRSTQ